MKPKYPGAKGMGYTACAIQRLEVAAAKEGEQAKVEYEITVSNEFEMARADWGGAWREILDHGPGAIVLGRFASGGSPFLSDHDTRDQIGVLEGARVEDRALKVRVRWANTSRAQEFRSMVDDGIRPNVSIGWVPKLAKLVEKNKEKGDLWRVMRWEPMEASSVAIPANPTVGFGRAEVNVAGYAVEVVTDEPPTTEAKKMKRVRGENGAVIEVADDDPRETLNEFQMASHNHAEIVRLCEAHGVSGLTADFIQRGLSPEAVALEILNRKRGAAPISQAAKDALGDPLQSLGHRERSRYSYARALSSYADQTIGKGRFDGLEAEVHQELERAQNGLKMHQKMEHSTGILVPWDLRTAEQQWADAQRLHKATLTSIVATKGAETVFDSPGQLIELLRNQAAVVSLGAQTLTGLSGPIAFPKQTGPATAVWVGENPGADVTASDVALGLVQLTPRTLQATSGYSRQLLVQSSLDVEAMVRNDLALVHALAIDRAAIHGLGAAGEPLGVYGATDVTSQAMGGAVDFIELTSMIGKVADASATLGTLGWVTTALMSAKWLATLDFSAAAAGRAIWQGTVEVGGTGRVAGYRAVATNQVSKLMTGSAPTGGTDHGIVFGNWADMILGFFGALEVIIDPYALKKRGIVEVTSFQMSDVIVRHGQSFCKATGATLA